MEFDVNDPRVWGVFTEALDSLAVVQTGFVVGVDRKNHKMQILSLKDGPVDIGQAPTAATFSVQKSGPGKRRGLMASPVAVTAIGSTILVLENGNQRVQAFDTSGNSVNLFQGQTTNIMRLNEPGTSEYLDISVDLQGYIFVLSYINGGLTPADYLLDIYTPNGDFLTRSTGIAAARMALDNFRNLYTLNYEELAGAPSVEPSLSQWFPSTPDSGADPLPAPTPEGCPPGPTG